jgi:tRNA(Ile)-lysidine synthase
VLIPRATDGGGGPLPLTDGAFADLMAPLGPFEPKPLVAVACSGGVDSLTLLDLASAWARSRGGSVLALCFDHGLRPESAAEAEMVLGVARSLDAEGRILRWIGDKPASGLHERARAARRAALEAACVEAGCLHLLMAHHGDDQAETVWQRLARGSGPDGLAAMAAVSVRPALRLLRPFLGQSKARLIATARARGLTWAEDPSNASLRYERGRQRAMGDVLAALGGTPSTFRDLADRAGRDRDALERRLAPGLADLVETVGEGWLRLSRDRLAAAAPWEAARALAWAASALSGAAHPIDPRPLADLLGAPPPPGRGRTLGGCLWWAEGRDHLLVCRECRGLDRRPMPLAAGVTVSWDGRYEIEARRAGLVVAALGEGGWTALRAGLADARPPARAAWSLPTLWEADKALDPKGILAVPSLGVWRYPGTRDETVSRGDGLGPGAPVNGLVAGGVARVVWRPRLPLVPFGTRGVGRRL